MESLITPAVVVRVVEYGEADRVLTLLTRGHGKVAALARGARRSRKRFAAHGALFTVGEAELRERPGAELATLVRLDPDPGAPQLANASLDAVRLCHASYLAELARELSPARQAEPAMFDLLLEALALLCAGPARSPLLRAFELRALRIAGLLAALDRCARCGAPAGDEPGQRFDSIDGGLVCGACRGVGPAVDATVRSALAALGEGGLAEAASASLPAPVNEACRAVLTGVALAHLGRPLRSLTMLQELAAAARR